MYSATPPMRSIAQHILVPGIICLILASLLLSWWELRRLTGTGSTAVNRWLATAGITAGVMSVALIAVRFIGID